MLCISQTTSDCSKMNCRIHEGSSKHYYSLYINDLPKCSNVPTFVVFADDKHFA